MPTESHRFVEGLPTVGASENASCGAVPGRQKTEWIAPGAGGGFVAVYAVNRRPFDRLPTTASGVVGYFLRKLDVPLAPIMLGVVPGPLVEKNPRRALALSGGNWDVLFSSPLTVGRWVLAAASRSLPRVLSKATRRASVTSGQPSRQ